MIDLIAAAGIGGIASGAFVWWTMKDKAADGSTAADHWYESYHNVLTAHCRCGDALATTTRRLEKIRELADTPQTIRKADVRAVLDGEV